ncbi:hypothetical protein G6F22_021731 [Rhizopus arrhizus]|nr:hypothetical protein G6F22_021731 [Rhizopus arrhizus]
MHESEHLGGGVYCEGTACGLVVELMKRPSVAHRRSKVARMFREGHGRAAIAQALGVPPGAHWLTNTPWWWAFWSRGATALQLPSASA